MGEASLEETRLLGKKLLTSVSNVNNAPRLLSILAANSAAVDFARLQCRLDALRSLHAFFVALLRAGKLFSAARKKVKPIRGGGREGNGDPEHNIEDIDSSGRAEATYRLWLWSKYREFKKALFIIIFRQESAGLLRVSAFNTLMELVREERPGEFYNALYLKICERMIGCKGQSNEIWQLLISTYFKYSDVRYFTYCNVEKIVVKWLARKQEAHEFVSSDEDNNQDQIGASFHKMVLNVFEMLSSIPQKSETVEEEIWASPLGGFGEEKVVTGAKQEKTRKETSNTAADNIARPKDRKKQKAAFTKAWLAFLRLSIPAGIYKKVLARLHQSVIPFMTNPLLLSDFLTQSYNSGGLISVMALSSLFILITKYGLEYPDFYNKLYALLEPSIFVAKYRSHFFELLDTCLKSSLLPGYLGAAFAKRLGRLVLSAPPSGAIVVIALIHNLLRRHPSINILVHRPDISRASSVREESTETNEGRKSDSDSEQEHGIQPELGGRIGADPFVATETDTAKCNALRSSLWEIEALRRHYCPAVSRFVESLETDLTIRAKTTEVAIRDFSPASYATIFGEEVGRRLKSVPLAFYSSVPSTIFPKKDSDDSFKGWSFEELADVQANRLDASKGKETDEAIRHDLEDVSGKIAQEDVNLDDSIVDTPSEEFSSDGSSGSRSRSEQSDGDDWRQHQPLLKKSRGL